MDEIAVDRDPSSIHNLTISPDRRAYLSIALIAEIIVTGVEEEQHDLVLLFLAFRPPIIATLQCLVPLRCSDFPRAGFSLRADALRGQ